MGYMLPYEVIFKFRGALHTFVFARYCSYISCSNTHVHAKQAEYLEVKNSQRRIFMTEANDAWKKLKSRLRRENFVGDDVMKLKEKVPDLIKNEDWEKFCDNENTEAQRLLRKRNKDIKDNCEQKTTHNTGRHGYARTAAIWEETHGRPPSSAKLWLYSHKTKEGVYTPHDEKFTNHIKLLLKVFQERGEKETLDSGPIYEVFGKDSRGRVRCVGSNIFRKAMLTSAFAHEMLAKVSMKDNGCEEKVDKIMEEVERMKSAFTQFIEDFKSGKFVSVRHNFETSRTTETLACENPLSVPLTRLTTQSQVGDDEINCNILSYKGEIVGSGRKLKIGVVTEVHGHKLKLREVKVVLDKILMPNHSLWGGQQGCATTLEDVDVGEIMYWHDNFLPCIDG
ncbi:hypothetical protein LguiB_008703 [Lonicera macranthoides]